MNYLKEIENVHGREDLVVFLRSTLQDLKVNPSSWNNSDLTSFLEAMIAWIEDMDGYYLNKNLTPPTQPTWNTLAEIIAAARIYE